MLDYFQTIIGIWAFIEACSSLYCVFVLQKRVKKLEDRHTQEDREMREAFDFIKEENEKIFRGEKEIP